MAKQKDKFIDGCVAGGMSLKLAKELFAKIETFAAYGFNKCVTGDTYVYHGSNGERVRVKDLYSKKIKETGVVWGLDGDDRLCGQEVKSVHENGVKQIWEIKLRSGRRLRVTGNHPVRTFDGWQEAAKLAIGERVAVAKKMGLGKASGVLSHPPILHQKQENKLKVSTLDTIPIGVLRLIREEMKEKGFGIEEMVSQTGLSKRLFSDDRRKRGYTREVLTKINEVLESETLRRLIEADVFWDEVVGVEKQGKEMTYDLTLTGEHNFLANDVVVHNSHAASYGMVSYWTAYLKANYPVEYMTALLTAEAGNTDKLVEAIAECDRMGITILAPDINESLTGFTIVEQDGEQVIRFGLGAIKNVGEAAVGAILEERDKLKFTSLADFCSRVDARKVNKKVIESLIKAGAFDAFGNRAALIAGVDEIRNKAASMQKKKSEGQDSLFGQIETESDPMRLADSLPEVAEWPLRDKLKFEKELLGFYLSDNPVKSIMARVAQRVTHRINQLDPEHHIGQTVTLGGMVIKVRQVVTKKNNDLMAFVRLEDDTSVVDGVVFPKLYAETKELWEEDKSVLVTGKVDYREETINLVINEVEYVDVSKEEKEVKEIEIPRGTDKEVLMMISKLLKENPGDDHVRVVVPNGGGPKIIDLPYGVDFSDEVREQVAKLLS